VKIASVLGRTLIATDDQRRRLGCCSWDDSPDEKKS